jgi:hypothetical protein
MALVDPIFREKATMYAPALWVSHASASARSMNSPAIELIENS